MERQFVFPKVIEIIVISLYLIFVKNKLKNGENRETEKTGFFGQKDLLPKNELVAGGVRKWCLGG